MGRPGRPGGPPRPRGRLHDGRCGGAGQPGGRPGSGRGAKRNPAGDRWGSGAGWWGIPAMTDFRAKGTIMGPAGLTAVFGMGTGGAPPVWSPGKRPAGGLGHAGRGSGPVVRHTASGAVVAGIISAVDPSKLGIVAGWQGLITRSRPPRRRVGVVKSLGCWDWSAAAVARRARPAHRPGRLPGAFAALEAAGNLVSKRASRLDAFSAYPIPTWLPGDAPSGTAGTPAVGPPQSSRTRGDPPQVSYTHGR